MSLAVPQGRRHFLSFACWERTTRLELDPNKNQTLAHRRSLALTPPVPIIFVLFIFLLSH